MTDQELAAAIKAEYQKNFNRAPNANEAATDLANAQKYGLTNPTGPTGGVLGGISARVNNTPGSGQTGTPQYPYAAPAGAPAVNPYTGAVMGGSAPMMAQPNVYAVVPPPPVLTPGQSAAQLLNLRRPGIGADAGVY